LTGFQTVALPIFFFFFFLLTNLISFDLVSSRLHELLTN